MTRFTFLLAIFSGCLTFPASAQVPDSGAAIAPTKYFLVLQTPKRRIKFYEGSNIRFKLTYEKKRYSGRITQINKRSIVFWDAEIAFRDIEKISIPTRSRSGKALHGLGSLLKGAGGLFTLVGGGNYFAVPEDRQSGKVTFGAGLGSYLVGRSLQGFQKHTYKINKNHVLKAYPF